MSDLIEKRRKRFGQDRVHLTTEDGTEVGHVDLVNRTAVLSATGFEREVNESFARLIADANGTQVPTAKAASRRLMAEGNGIDFATNSPGAGARVKRNEVNAKAPIKNLIARVFDIETEERDWRIGAKSEAKVGKELAKLDASWRVLHSVPVNDKKSDIDHMVIGPAGVFTLNSTSHPKRDVWVAHDRILLDGYPTDYLRTSRFEAQRAAKMLTAACGFEVQARSAIVFVDFEDFTVKRQPEDVNATTPAQLLYWLGSLPTKYERDTVEKIFAKARFAGTWRQ
jgi:Nuclease-related domain